MQTVPLIKRAQALELAGSPDDCVVAGFGAGFAPSPRGTIKGTAKTQVGGASFARLRP